MAAAAAGLIPAVPGALSQELVDLATILNALRSLKPREMATAAGPAATPSAAPLPARPTVQVHEDRTGADGTISD